MYLRYYGPEHVFSNWSIGGWSAGRGCIHTVPGCGWRGTGPTVKVDVGEMEPDTFVPFSSFYIPKNQYKAARRHFVPFRRPQLRAASAATRAAARCATDASWLRTASRRAETPVHRTIVYEVAGSTISGTLDASFPLRHRVWIRRMRSATQGFPFPRSMSPPCVNACCVCAIRSKRWRLYVLARDA